MTHWFTADCHYNHKNILRLSNRPFRSIGEMDQAIFDGWKGLKKGDTLYILGDIALNKNATRRAFFGIPDGVQVHYIFGNHDSGNRRWISNHRQVVWCGDLKTARIDGHYLVMFHYAMRTWPLIGDGSWQLHGHSHGNLNPWDNQLDVGVDNAAKLIGEYRPFSFDEVRECIDSRVNPRAIAKQLGARTPSWVGGDHHDEQNVLALP